MNSVDLAKEMKVIGELTAQQSDAGRSVDELLGKQTDKLITKIKKVIDIDADIATNLSNVIEDGPWLPDQVAMLQSQVIALGFANNVHSIFVPRFPEVHGI